MWCDGKVVFEKAGQAVGHGRKHSLKIDASTERNHSVIICLVMGEHFRIRSI